MTYHYCQWCEYSTYQTGHYNDHCKSARHKKNEGNRHSFKYVCTNCFKGYASRSSFFVHKKGCKKPVPLEEKENEPEDEPEDEPENKFVEVLPNTINNITNNSIDNSIDNSTDNSTNTNSHNNITNNNNVTVNMILDEKCANAVNFQDMIRAIIFPRGYFAKIFNEENFVKLNADMFEKELNKIPIKERPLQCVDGEDGRQKILHIRHDNTWVEESEKDMLFGLLNAFHGHKTDNHAMGNSFKILNRLVIKNINTMFSDNKELCEKVKRAFLKISRNEIKQRELAYKIIDFVCIDSMKLKELLLEPINHTDEDQEDDEDDETDGESCAEGASQVTITRTRTVSPI